MRSKTELISRLDVAREALRDALEGVDTEQEICPGWTVNGLLAHISGWDEYAIPWFRAVAAGDAGYKPPWRGINVHNAEFVAEREGLSEGALKMRLLRIRKRLRRRLDGLRKGP